MAAGGKSRPHHTIAVDVHAARIEARRRNLEDMSLARFGSIVSTFQLNEHSGIRILADAPNGIVNRARDYRVKIEAGHRIEFRIVRSRRSAAATTTASAT